MSSDGHSHSDSPADHNYLSWPFYWGTRLILAYPWATIASGSRWPVAALALTATRLGYRTSRLDLINPKSDYNRLWLEYIKEFGAEDDAVIVVEGERPRAGRARARRTVDGAGPRGSPVPRRAARSRSEQDSLQGVALSGPRRTGDARSVSGRSPADRRRRLVAAERRPIGRRHDRCGMQAAMAYALQHPEPAAPMPRRLDRRSRTADRQPAGHAQPAWRITSRRLPTCRSRSPC